MDYSNPGDGSADVFGGPHLSLNYDMSVIAYRSALALAVSFGIGIADYNGPKAAATASLNSGTQVVLQITSGTLAALGTGAISGLGFTISQNGQTFYAVHTALANNTLTIDFNTYGGSIGNGATLFYEYGLGRLALSDPQGTGANPNATDTFGAPAGGNAIYDTSGLPLFDAPGGMTISAPGVSAAAGFNEFLGTAAKARLHRCELLLLKRL